MKLVVCFLSFSTFTKGNEENDKNKITPSKTKNT